MDNQQIPLRTLELFAGAGGGILGGHLLGEECVCAVEYNAYARSVLLARQNDGTLPPFPIWDDVCTFDGKPWTGRIDVVSGGFPCQDISAAGKGAGLDGERSGLWREMARIIGEVRPDFVRVENSPMLTSRGMGTILGDLSEMGFDARWGIISCADTGGVHLRQRMWIIATNSEKLHSYGGSYNGEHEECTVPELGNSLGATFAPNVGSERRKGLFKKEIYRFTKFPWGEDVRGIEDLRKRSDLPEPLVRRIGDDVAFGMDRLKAIGNGQVPRVAETAWRILSNVDTP